ncbi:MAG: oligosaccharide flippase family protein [Candidatus Thorarchaeota archaeon]
MAQDRNKNASTIKTANLGDTVISYGSSTVARLALNLVTLGVLARVLTIDQMGIVVSFNFLLAMYFVLTDLGLGSGLINKLSASVTDSNLQSAYVRGSLITKTITTTVMVLIFCCLSGEVSLWLTGVRDNSFLYLLLSPSLFFHPISSTVKNIFVGCQRIPSMVQIEVPVSLVGSAVTIILALSGFGPASFIYGRLLADGFFLLFSLLVIYSWSLLRGPFIMSITEVTRLLWTSSGALFFSSSAAFLAGWFDRSYLLVRVSLTEAAIYGIAASIYTAVLTLPNALSIALFPKYSELQTVSLDLLKRRIANSYRIVLHICVITMIMTAALAPILVIVVAGSTYLESITPLRILALLGLSSILSVSVTGLPVVLGIPQKQAAVNLTAALLGISASLLLGFQMDSLLMAIIKGSISAITALGVFLFVKRKLELEVNVFHTFKSLFSGILTVIVMFLILEVMGFGLAGLSISLALGIATYLFLVRITGSIESRDLDIVEGVSGRVFRPLVRSIRRLLML